MEQASKATSAGSSHGEMLSAVLTKAAALLGSDPASAEKQALDILERYPGQQQALLLLVCARRVRGDASGAQPVLEAMSNRRPDLASVQYELGLLAGSLGDSKVAFAALSRAVDLEPNNPVAWRALGNQLVQSGKSAAAARPYAFHSKASIAELRLLESALAGGDEQLTTAQNMLGELLKIQPTDVFTLFMLARIAILQTHYEQAELLLARVLEIARGFAQARRLYMEALGQQMKWSEADAQLDILFGQDLQDTDYRRLKALNFRLLGKSREAQQAYEQLLAEHKEDAVLWTGYGHVLRDAGRRDDAIAAYRKAVTLQPGLGTAWWGLASFKTYRLTREDIETIQGQLRDGVDEENRVGLQFSLGKALEDEEAFAESFEHYRLGNALVWRKSHSDRRALDEYIDRHKSLFTEGFLRDREVLGSPRPDPIFIVGLPRSGSTLVEQILSSHSAIEGTSELPDIVHISNRLDRRRSSDPVSPYPEILGTFGKAELESLGEEYLERTRSHRKLGRPLFIDKATQNFEHIGLIHLMLPNAKIIDIRRHPLACGFSVYKQHFMVGLNYAYDLGEIGHYYRRYVELMAHYDAVMPGRIHRVFYEELVRDPEGEIRRLLDYCGVPFEETCVRFYETDRRVLTMSSEQVRRPMYAEAIDHWRNYEPWLGPLKKELGPVLDAYPAVPGM